MQPFNWGRFVTRININAEVPVLYKCWATRAGMENWFLRLSEFKSKDGILRKNNEPVSKGDTYTWRWHGWSDETTEYGEILDCNGTNMIQFSFGQAGNCTVTIKEEHGATIVELLQENIPETDEGKHYWHLGCKTGWTFYLANLKSMCEGGVDLRNKNEQLTRMINC